jgi:hypothetical protein
MKGCTATTIRKPCLYFHRNQFTFLVSKTTVVADNPVLSYVNITRDAINPAAFYHEAFI